MANPLAPIGKPPVFNTNTGDYTWLNWYNQVATQFYNNDNPNAVVTKNISMGTGFLFPCDTSSGSITLTLPKASMARGKKYLIKKVTSDTNTVTISPYSGDSIEGNSSWTLSKYGDYVELISDGVLTWYVEGASVSTSAQGDPRNIVINGNFDVWQRGTTFSDTGSISSNIYSADRWAFYSGVSGLVAISRQSAGLQDFDFCVRITKSASSPSTAPIYLVQAYETVDAIKLQGQSVSFSFWARCGSGFTNGGVFPGGYACEMSVQSGTGTDVGPFGAMGAYVTNFYFTPTTTWTQYTGTGTFPTNTTCFKTYFQWDSTAALASNNYLEITGFQMNVGSALANPVFPPFAESYLRCQRYYRKSFPYATAPASNTGQGGAITFLAQVVGTTGNMGVQVPFDPPMRISPTITTYCSGATGSSWYNVSASTSTGTAGTQGKDTSGMYLYRTSSSGVSAGNIVSIHYTADGELY